MSLTDGAENDIGSWKTRDEFAAALAREPLRFAYANGDVTGICPAADESAWTLNVKRGVLSAFGNALRDRVETDVVGRCPTTYSSTGVRWDGVETWSKSKQMRECTESQKLSQYALNIPDVNVQKMPLLEYALLTL